MTRRPGDDRPIARGDGVPLAVFPTKPFRWLPRHGQPFCVVEWVTQNTVKALAYFPVYLVVLAVVVLIVSVLVGGLS